MYFSTKIFHNYCLNKNLKGWQIIIFRINEVISFF